MTECHGIHCLKSQWTCEEPDKRSMIQWTL